MDPRHYEMAPVDLTLNNGNFPLNDVLKAMGLREVFDLDRAGLSYASKQSQVCLSSVIHKTVLGVLLAKVYFDLTYQPQSEKQLKC